MIWSRPFRVSVLVLVAIAAAHAMVDTAHAIEMKCVEASRYKHLYQIFGNDVRKYAEFLELKPTQLPDPETCRAIVVWGPMARVERGQETDFDKFYEAIALNRGGLATVYLHSGGGSIDIGLRLAQLTRLFGLKTRAVENNGFDYVPDFLHEPEPMRGIADVPPGLRSGWEAYQRSMGEDLRVRIEGRGRRCASACTFMHVAGIDRTGVAYFHRGRRSAPSTEKDRSPIDLNVSMAQVQEGLMRAEARVLELYREMDGGDEIAKLFKETSTLTVAPAVVPRFPRYVEDFLRARCRANILAPPPERRHEVERCVAVAFEKERLLQFARHCPNGCNRSELGRLVDDKMRQLGPETMTAPRQ